MDYIENKSGFVYRNGKTYSKLLYWVFKYTPHVLWSK